MKKKSSKISKKSGVKSKPLQQVQYSNLFLSKGSSSRQKNKDFMTAIKIQGPNSRSSCSSLILENENTIESRSEQSMSNTSSNSSQSGSSSIESISNARSINITLKDKDRPL